MNNKQVSFLKALLEESTISKACKKAGISRRTGYKYLKETEFAAELRNRQKETLDNTVRYLQGKLDTCNETLLKIIETDSVPSQVKINAINTVYGVLVKLTETVEITNRIEAIEDSISENREET